MTAVNLGKQGEEYLTEYLKTRGYAILEQNYHSQYGEIDIIASTKEALCFIEVKTRKLDSQVLGEYAIGKGKQQRIIKTALLYLQQLDNKQTAPLQQEIRFDVAVLTHQAEQIIHCEYYKAAFDGSAYLY